MAGVDTAGSETSTDHQLVLCDVNGNIGYVHTGAYPDRQSGMIRDYPFLVRENGTGKGYCL